MAKQTSKPLEKAEILKINPKVDPVLVEQHEKLYSELHRLGLNTRPKFNLKPPLGGDRLSLFNE